MTIGHLQFMMDSPGSIRLCRKIFAQKPAQGGSCLHVKKGALLEFTTHPRVRAHEATYVYTYFTNCRGSLRCTAAVCLAWRALSWKSIVGCKTRRAF